MAFKNPIELSNSLQRRSLNAPNYSMWVQNPQKEWKLWGGRDNDSIDDAFTQELKAKGYLDHRIVPNGEKWDYQAPKGYKDPSGYEWFDEEAKNQALADFNGYSNDLQKYYDEGQDLDAQFMQDYLKYRNRAYDYLARNKLI